MNRQYDLGFAQGSSDAERFDRDAYAYLHRKPPKERTEYERGYMNGFASSNQQMAEKLNAALDKAKAASGVPQGADKT